MTRNEFTWEHFSGRDSDGERFITSVMVHGSGRILARIRNPQADEYYWRVYFYVPKSVMEDDGHDFISKDSAVEYVEGIALAWDDEAMQKIINRKPARDAEKQTA